MDQLEDLSQRVFDIHQAIISAAGNPMDPNLLLKLESEMTKLENDVTLLEAKVDAQMPLLQQIPQMIEKFQKFYQDCKDMPSPAPVRNLSIRIPRGSPEEVRVRETPTEKPSRTRIPHPKRSGPTKGKK